jgi:hypothetical protein
MFLPDASDKEYWANVSLPWFDGGSSTAIDVHRRLVGLIRSNPGSILEELFRRRKKLERVDDARCRNDAYLRKRLELGVQLPYSNVAFPRTCERIASVMEYTYMHDGAIT